MTCATRHRLRRRLAGLALVAALLDAPRPAHQVRGARDHVRDIPAGLYTSPEISTIGQTVGMLTLLFHRETLEILGIHCFGQQATEIIHIGQAIMSQPAPNNTIKWFVNTTFNYPTMAEAYRVAALNGLNRLF